jgi:hypothetical protein
MRDIRLRRRPGRRPPSDGGLNRLRCPKRDGLRLLWLACLSVAPRHVPNGALSFAEISALNREEYLSALTGPHVPSNWDLHREINLFIRELSRVGRLRARSARRYVPKDWASKDTAQMTIRNDCDKL